MYSKADTHIHTTCSDGLMSPEETVEIVSAQTDLGVIAITDHGTVEGGLKARAHAVRHNLPLDVIVGQEISTREGDVVGLFLHSDLPTYKTAGEAIEAIHAQGGLAVAVHPFSAWPTLNNMRGVGPKILTLPFDAIEVINGFPASFLSNSLTAWLNRTVGRNLPELGGSDSHIAYTIGQALTWFPGRTAADLRQAIESGTIRAGGTLWTPLNSIRLVWAVMKQGKPHYQPVYSD